LASEPCRVGRRDLTSSPPQTPYVNLSIHTAPDGHLPAASQHQAYAYADPDSSSHFWLTTMICRPPHPLRSNAITASSTLLQDDPPPSCASILSPFVVHTYRVFSWHRMKSSHVPQKSPDQARANHTPDAAQPISRYLLSLSWSRTWTPVLTSSVNVFDATVGSLIAHLLDPHLTHHVRLFPNAHDRGF